MTPKTSKLKPPFEPTYIPGGIKKIVQIWEDLRDRNQDGYVPGGGLLANIKDHGGVQISKGTTCSPFTATVIGCAFDPKYPRKDLAPPVGEGDAYVPMFNGGKNPLQLPFLDFYHQHNNDNQPIESIVYYKLGYEVVDRTEMRRGDLLGITWNKKIMKDGKDYGYHGHAVFCWDVHLNKDQKVDCFQYIGANSSPNLCGVTIGGCANPYWLSGSPKSGKNPGTLEKAADRKGKIFEDSKEIVQVGQWLALPGVIEGSIKTDQDVQYSKPNTWTVRDVKVGRLYYSGDPPKPYCKGEDSATAKSSKEPGQVPGPTTTKKVWAGQKNTDVLKKVTPKPSQQDKDKELKRQHFIEAAMRQFYWAGWIKSDPGKSEDINDSKTKTAIKEFQETFDLNPDTIVGTHTMGAIEKQLPACQKESSTQELLAKLYRGKKLMADPGPPNGVNNAQTRDAVMEFQKKNGLKGTGLPDADTRAKLIEVLKGHEPTPTKPGLEPEIRHLYWLSSPVAPGESAKLRLHFRDLLVGQQCPIYLKDEASEREVEATVKLVVEKEEAEVSVPIPVEFGVGAKIHARVTAQLLDEGELESTTTAPLSVRSKPTSAIAIVNDDDVYLDPPVRLWPQYDDRWKRERIAGPKTSRLIDWWNNGCNASTAAMTLRWFAEDCGAGKIPFPTKPGGHITPSWYGLRMAESFWPNADPPGKVELTENGRIHFRKIYSVAAHYLKTGDIQRNNKEDVLDPSDPKAHYVTKQPSGGWLGLIRTMLKKGPVIVGLTAPAGHFVLAHGIIGRALLIVDPGGVLYQAHNGGTAEIANWKNKDGYLDGTMNKEKVRMPSSSQWPGGKAPGGEGDGRSYHLISDQFLNDLLDNLISLTSLTYPEGAKFGGAAVPSGDKKYRKWRITTYHIAGQGAASSSETVPVYDTSKNVLARVTPAFFSELALEGQGKMRDGRLLIVAGKGKDVSVDHNDYAGVWEYHKKYMVKHDGTPRPPGYSGLVVQADHVIRASSFEEVTASKLAKGYGTQRGIAYEPFRTLAADLGAHDKDDPRYKGKGGLVPAKTKVFIKEYVGVSCPDGSGSKFVHDGWFVVIDSGGGIFGAHFDVFVGTKEMGKQVKHPSQAQVWFEGIEDRVSEDYEYGLHDK